MTQTEQKLVKHLKYALYLLKQSTNYNDSSIGIAGIVMFIEDIESEKTLPKLQQYSKVAAWISDFKDVKLIKSLLLEALRKDNDLSSVLYNLASNEIDHHASAEAKIMRDEKINDDLNDQENQGA